MPPAALEEKAIENDPVRRWRLRVLVRAGYRPMEAVVLRCRTDIDLHPATRLVERGCPSETAMRILL